MEKLLIAKKNWSNASAFIEVDPQSRVVAIYGKFYEDDGWRRRGYPGPYVQMDMLLDENLIEEVELRGSCACTSQMSDELQAFIDKVWDEARKKEPWFAY